MIMARHRFRLIIVCAVAVVAAVAPDLMRPGDLSLLSRAKRTWVIPAAILPFGYRWLNDHTIVGIANGMPSSQAFVYDLKASRTLATFRAGTLSAQKIALVWYHGAVVSPDGHRALFLTHSCVEVTPLPSEGTPAHAVRSGPALTSQSVMQTVIPHIAMTRGGLPVSGFTAPNVNAMQSCIWTADGAAWLGAEMTANGISGSGCLFSLCSPDGRVLQQMKACGAFACPVAIGRLPNGNILLYATGDGLYEIATKPRLAVVQRWPTPFPGEREVGVGLSPDGKQLLWETEDEPPDFLRRTAIFLGHANLSKDRITLYVSQLDGSHMQEIGNQEWAETNAEPSFSGFHWMTDSRHISFVHKGAIYVMPVSEGGAER